MDKYDWMEQRMAEMEAMSANSNSIRQHDWIYNSFSDRFEKHFTNWEIKTDYGKKPIKITKGIIMEHLIEDNEKAVKKMIIEIYGTEFMTPDVFDPDPYAKYVWLAIDTKKKIALVVYLEDHDAEEMKFRGNIPTKYYRI